MQIRLSFKRMLLASGKTFAVPTVAGARVRVVDGMVWATTSSSPDDLWLGAGDEHTVQRPGLTVVESVAHSTVELIPPLATGTRGHIMNRYDIRIPRAACNVAAIAMTALTIGLLVVFPSKMAPDRHDVLPSATANLLAATPDPWVPGQPGGEGKALDRTISQASSGVAPATRVQ